MRKNAFNKVKNNLGRGNVIIIVGPYSKALHDFCNNDLALLLKNNSLYKFPSSFPKKYLYSTLENMLNGTKVYDCFFVDRLCDYADADKIINLFKGRNDVNLIATSNINLNVLLNDKSSNVRGRIVNVYIPPFLYEDYLYSKSSDSLIGYLDNNRDDLSKLLSEYKYKNEALKLYSGLNYLIGFPTALTNIFSNLKMDVSINTFISIFNYLVNHGFLYHVRKFDLEKNDFMSNLAYCYPTFVGNIIDDSPIDKINKRIFETLVVSKLIDDGNMVFKASYRSREKQSWNELFNTFLVMNTENKYLLKLYFEENEESLSRYKNHRSIYKKYVLLLNDIDKYTDDYGVTYYGVEAFLEKGLY